MNQFTKAVKSLAAKYNETSLILRIAIGLLIGAALALICPGAVWLEEFGSLFVGALKGIAPVLVFVIVASALAQGSSKLDRRFGTVVWLYMLTTFVAAALSPADVVSVTVLPGTQKACRVIVPDDQLSLAIGKEGQNARLAARLTGYKIDIKPASHSED